MTAVGRSDGLFRMTLQETWKIWQNVESMGYAESRMILFCPLTVFSDKIDSSWPWAHAGHGSTDSMAASDWKQTSVWDAYWLDKDSHQEKLIVLSNFC